MAALPSAATPATIPPITPTPFNWPVTGGIIAAVAAMAGLVYFLLIHRRYRYAPSTYPVEVERPVMPPPPKLISYPAAINIQEVIGRFMAAVATAIAGGIGFLVSIREVITRLLASAATAIAGGIGSLIGKREVIGRFMAAIATAIIGWVRLLLSKWKSKKPR